MTCARCGLSMRRVHGRGLCQHCYYRVQVRDALDQYETLNERRYASDLRPDCACAVPVPEPIPLFRACQCARCGKRLLT